MEQVVPEVATEIAQEIKEPVVYRAGDLCIKCFKCSAVNTLQENVNGGLRFDMYTTDQHKIILRCPTCGNKMELFYTESKEVEILEEVTENPTTENVEIVETEEIENEPVLEESQG